MRDFRCLLWLSWGIALALVAHSSSANPLLRIPNLSQQGLAKTTDQSPGDSSDNAARLRLAQRALEESDPADTTAAQNAAAEVAVLQSIEAVSAQQNALEQQIKDLSARKADLEAQLKAPLPTTTSEYTFADLDRMKDELAAERARAILADDKLDAAKVALQAAQGALAESERNRRQAQEAAEVGRRGPRAPELAAVAEQAAQTARLARQTVELREREVQRARLALEIQQLAVQIGEARINRVAPLVTFSEADLKSELESIAQKEQSARNSLQQAQQRLAATDGDLEAKQQAFDSETGDRTLLGEELEALRLERERLTTEIDLLTQRLQRLSEVGTAWRRRFQIASAPGGEISKSRWEELSAWRSATQDVLLSLNASLRSKITQMRDLRTRLASINNKAEGAAPEVRQAIDRQRSNVERTLQLLERGLASLEDSRRVHEKLADEIGHHVKPTSPVQWLYGLWAKVEETWDFELTSIEQDGITRQITVGKIIEAAAVFVVGWALARILAAIFANRLLRRFRLSKDATAAIRTLVFYVLLIASALVALRWAEVPLTAFTILGGALAIGVGFGSQALVNNFIGGLIMLAERPVRLGERILFGKYDGTVEEVGFRCTKLRTVEDHLITIPNSTLVNEPIENAARRRTIRRTLNLAIRYDTPREQVMEAVEAIRDLLEERGLRERIHPIVGFDEMKPRVFFDKFNPESLNIQVVYWYAPPAWWDYLAHCEIVNFRIMEELERIGVEFAIPSRMVYGAGDPRREPESHFSSLSGNHPRKSSTG